MSEHIPPELNPVADQTPQDRTQTFDPLPFWQQQKQLRKKLKKNAEQLQKRPTSTNWAKSPSR